MLNISNLNVAYGDSRVLNDVSLNIPAGQIVCLMGRNGMGKTTLLKAIMGLLRVQQGKITYEDKDMTALPPYRRARSGIGYVPQGRGIFPYLTVYENLLIGLEATPQKMNDYQGILDEIYETFPV